MEPEILAASPVSVAAGLPPWQRELKAAVRSVAELECELGLDLIAAEAASSAADASGLLGQGNGEFPLFVPRRWLKLMRRGDARDPLLLQVLATAQENRTVPGFTADPLDEARFEPVPGVLHKYAGRVLLVLTGACAINCRYCFRRNFPYDHAPRTPEQLAAALEYIRADESVEEVLLSGGDPLMLADEKLENLVQSLQSIPHLQRLRVHTRMPVVLPERITNRLITLLRESRLQPVVMIHANHPRELDEDVAAALERLRNDARVTLLNQSVLLRGVNDDTTVLADLSRRLMECGVLPCYLHQLDRVAGTAHFAVADDLASQLVSVLRERLPGYLVPRLVREIAGEKSKTPVT
jgi:L-lysine 2,3-aminomutase